MQPYSDTPLTFNSTPTPAYGSFTQDTHHPYGYVTQPETDFAVQEYPENGCSTRDYPQCLTVYHGMPPPKIQTWQPSATREAMRYPSINAIPKTSTWNQSENFSNQHQQSAQFSSIVHREYGASHREGPSLGSDGLQGTITSTFAKTPPRSRRGPFRSYSDREQTAQTRKIVACVRCRMQHIRCIPDPSDMTGICLTCKNVTNIKMSKLPCLRYKITDVRMFKPGQTPGREWTSRWSNQTWDNISIWSSTETKSIQITEAEGWVSTPVTLEVREFIPLEGDMLHRSWAPKPGGVKKSVQVPPYAITNLTAAQQAYEDYISRGGADFFKSVFRNHKDKLIWETYSTAIEAADNRETAEEERRLLKMVLKLWITIRLTTHSQIITGNETLGMPVDIMDETSPLHGRIPLPPVMGAQIDLVLIHQIQWPLRVRVLDALQKLLLANKRSSWFTIYLCFFILLHNCSMITKHDAGYAIKHGLPGRYARPVVVEEYHAGANIMLAHFHYCNKGRHPFTLDALELGTRGGLNAKQTSFIQRTGKYAKENAHRFESLRWQETYEDDYYFISQLFEAEWKPRSTI